MPKWYPRPKTTCCAVILGNDSNYVGYDPQLDERQGDHFCGKPVDHQVQTRVFDRKISLNLCTNHFTWLVTWTMKYPLRTYPS